MTGPAESPSEFGRGIVVCLAKFSEHLSGRWYERVRSLADWEKLTEEQRTEHRQRASVYPHGDSARLLSEVEPSYGSLSNAIELWMNAASDHFYDLDEKAPPALKELAGLALIIGHGFTGHTWTMDDVERIRTLWQKACLEVDRALLGVDDADWGTW